MTQDATSEPSEHTDTPSATEDDQAQLMLAEAVANVAAAPGSTDSADQPEPESAKPADDGKGDKLGDSGKRALTSERKARRDAEKRLNDLTARLQQYEDRDKTELQKAQEQSQQYQQELSATRVANARLMAAAIHNIPPDLIDLLGDGTDEEIDGRAQLLAEKLAAVAAPASATEPSKPAPAAIRPVESLTPGAKPANEAPTDPNEAFRSFVNSRRT